MTIHCLPFLHVLSAEPPTPPHPILIVTCLDDLWQWLSGTLEAHPIWGSRFSFLVTSGTFDGFLLSADMFHNCQNFDWSGIFEKKNIKEFKKKAPSPHFLTSVPKSALCEVHSPIIYLSVTCWPGKMVSSLLFYSPVPCILLVWAFSRPHDKSFCAQHYQGLVQRFTPVIPDLARWIRNLRSVWG